MSNIIYQNSKCIIRCIDDYYESKMPVPETIKHVTAGIVPSVMDHEGMNGFLFLTLVGHSYFDSKIFQNFFIDEPDPISQEIIITNLHDKNADKKYIVALIESLIKYKLCTETSRTCLSEEYISLRAKELSCHFMLYEEEIN